MDLLILTSHFNDDPFYDSFLQSLTQSATVFLDDFDSFARACNNTTPQLLVLLSYEDTIPSNWDIKRWNTQKPMIILVDVKNMYLPTIDMFIEFLNSFAHLKSHPEKDFFEHPLFRDSLVYIEENLYDRQLSLKEVASLMYVSHSYYSRLFRKYLGTGFKEYITAKRVQQAKLLLRKGHSVTNTCFNVGYNDLTNFSRNFKKVVGITPSCYRQKWLNNNSTTHEPWH